jgi:hypothetical protein
MGQDISSESISFERQIAGLSKTRLKLQISGGALIAIVSASHLVSGFVDGDFGSKGLSLFGLAIGLYAVAHYSMLLKAKRVVGVL